MIHYQSTQLFGRHKKVEVGVDNLHRNGGRAKKTKKLNLLNKQLRMSSVDNKSSTCHSEPSLKREQV